MNKKHLLIGGVLIVILILVFQNPGPFVGTWTVDSAMLADEINTQLASRGLPAMVPAGLGNDKLLLMLGLTGVEIELKDDESWQGQLSNGLGLLPCGGTWTASGDDITLDQSASGQPSIRGQRVGRNVFFELPVRGNAMMIPFTR
ncbi:MAG: hypothetical protein HND57_02320 [Planctomycetes bacterium]|nr:hypothetical protein [Planctomycetota bacterium]